MVEELKNDITLGDVRIKTLYPEENPLVSEKDFINKFNEKAKNIIKHLIETPQDNNPFDLRIFYLVSTDGIYYLTECSMQAYSSFKKGD